MTDPATCPACGGLNQCAMATAASTPCWCFSVPVAASAVAALPETERNARCLCPRCAAGLGVQVPPEPEVPHAD